MILDITGEFSVEDMCLEIDQIDVKGMCRVLSVSTLDQKVIRRRCLAWPCV